MTTLLSVAGARTSALPSSPMNNTTTSAMPSATLTPLLYPDGSARYSANGYTVIASINGPLEVQRRDEIPEEAFFEVLVRPAIGVGGPREREVEGKIRDLLKGVVDVRRYPRSLIQLTLLLEAVPEGTSGLGSTLPLLPPLLNTTLLALLSSSLALRTTFLTTLICTSNSTTSLAPITDPSPKSLASASSTHVFTFSLSGSLLLSESEGAFSLEEYEEAYTVAKSLCLKGQKGEDVDMDVEGASAQDGSLESWVRDVVKQKVLKEQRWRGENA